MSVHVSAPPIRPTRHLEALLVVLTSIAVGVALVVEPTLVFLPLGGLLSAFLLIDGRARIVFVVFAGIFVLQRNQEFDKSKMAFLALFAVAFVGAFLNVRSLWNTRVYRCARTLLLASNALVALAAVSLAVAHHNGTPLVGGWLRDVAPYLLLASVPIFALDAQASLSKRGLIRLLVSAGTAGTLAFAIAWLDRRGIAHLYASSIGLASYFLPAALFSYGMSAVLQARRTKWLFLSAMVLALLLITGTRLNLVLLAAPLAIAFGARRYRATRALRLAFLGPVALALTLGLGIVAFRLSNADEQQLAGRITVLESTGSLTDQSYVERLRQGRAAWRVFESNPVLGAGAGTDFEWQTVSGTRISSFTLDTPLSFPAKFGLVGLGVLLIVIGGYWSFTKRLIREYGASTEQLALVGYLAVAAASGVAGMPFDDKGFSFGLMLLVALALWGKDDAAREGETTPGRDAFAQRV
jgi:hypothetical protein